MQGNGDREKSAGLRGGLDMSAMMERMPGEMGEFSPMAACQAMMASVSRSAELAAFATPEVRTLFEEWAAGVEHEMVTVLRDQGTRDLVSLAAAMKLSPEATLQFLTRLARDGRVTISEIELRENGGGA